MNPLATRRVLFFESISSPGELLLHELVVRLVVVEALHHVIAIAIRIRAVHVVLVAVRFGEANHIQPVASPLFAVARRCQQPVDQLLPSVRRLIAHKRVDFLRCRRQAVQIEGDPANQRGSVGLGRRFQTGFLQACQDERIDRCFDPGLVLRGSEGRRSYVFSGLKCPMTYARPVCTFPKELPGLRSPTAARLPRRSR